MERRYQRPGFVLNGPDLTFTVHNLHMMTLFEHPGSSNCYKIRLMFALLGVDYACVTFEHAKSHNRSSEFLKQNPRGLVPVLEAEGNYIWDSTAILVYLARRFDGESWLSVDGLAMSRVMQWLALSQSEILHGLMAARHIILGKRRGVLEDAQGLGRVALGVLEDRLQRNNWLASEGPTIADIACYPHVSRAPESGIPLDAYPAMRRWIARVEELPGWVPWTPRAG